MLWLQIEVFLKMSLKVDRYLSRYLVGLAAELYSHYTTEYLAEFFCLKYRPTYHNNKQAAVLITQVVLINLTLQVSE